MPKQLTGYTARGTAVALHGLWLRRQTTKFNGVPYIVQCAAQAVYTPQGQQEIKQNIALYMQNARVIVLALEKAGLQAFGGKNAPYIWLKTPKGLDSWAFFDKLLTQAHIVGTPGVGFGSCGEGFFRLTAFNTPQLTQEAAARLSRLQL